MYWLNALKCRCEVFSYFVAEEEISSRICLITYVVIITNHNELLYVTMCVVMHVAACISERMSLYVSYA